MAAIVAAVLLAAPASMAQQGPGGGGGGGGEPTDVGSEYSDLVVALRDVDGLPIFAEFETLEGTSYCVQPVATEPLPGLDPTGIENPVDGTTVYPIPLMGDSLDLTEDDEVCDPQPAYAMYVSEAELERLNMARTDDDVLDQKLDDVMRRLLGTDQPVTLDPAGRLVIDGVVTDAGPEHAALFEALMLTGTIPGLDEAYRDTDGTAQIGPFGPWELAAVSLGSAASKFVPVTIDATIYYNRITDVAEPTVAWRDSALSLLGRDPTYTGVNEEFVDYRDFSYTRADVFPGCATWLDVPTLTWRTGPIVELAEFAPLPPIEENGTLTNVAAFAQLAADVRSTVFYLHENEVIAGFYMDPVGQNTCAEQLAALTAPAVDFGPLPEEIVQTETFAMDASLYNPLDGTALDQARLKITVDAVDGDFTDGTVITAVAGLESITFSPDGAGNLVGWWGPDAGFPVPVRYNETTTFQVRVGEAAPSGMYNLTLELIVPTPDGPALATDTATINVLDDVVTARWTDFPGYVDQAVNATATSRVFNPETALPTPVGTQLKLTVVGPEVTDPAEALIAEDLQVYVNAVKIPMALDGTSVVGFLDLPELATGAATEVLWYVMVADGAPIGMYEMTIEVIPAAGDNRSVGDPDTEDMYVGPAETHGEAPDDPGNGDGEETTTTTTTLPPPPSGPVSVLLTDEHDASTDTTFDFGSDGDTILAGDWNADGTDTIGTWSARTWSLRNSNTTGEADVTFIYGLATDIPVTGDWNDDDVDTAGVVRVEGRNLRWLLRDSNSGGSATVSFLYGVVGDIPIVGDWDGDGIDEPGVVRAPDGQRPRFLLRTSLSGGTASISFIYGAAGDEPLMGGDWNGDATDTIGVRRGAEFLLRDALSAGPASVSYSFGEATDAPVVGDWDGDGTDTAGVAHVN